MRTNLLLAFFSAVLTLVVVGGMLELRLRSEAAADRAAIMKRYRVIAPCMRKAAVPELIYERIPHACGANSIGFIDREHAVAKGDGVKRIVVIGDSVAEGRPEYSFSGDLQALLDEHFGTGAWEVIKFVVNGYSTEQELVLFREYGRRYAPDLILWSYVLNDPAHPVFHRGNADMGRFHHEPTSYLLHYVERSWFALRERIRRHWRDCPEEYHQLLHCAYRDEIVDNLRRIAAAGRESGVPLILVVHPVFQKEGWERYSLTDVHQRLSEAAKSSGLEVTDLLDDFRRYPVDELRTDESRIWYDPWHPNRKGHKVIARSLFSYVTAQPSTAKLFAPGS